MFNHQASIAFTIRSKTPDGSDITPEEYEAALQKRIADVRSAGEWEEAVGLDDTVDEAAFG